MHHTSSSGPGRSRQSRSSIMQGSIWLHMLIVALVLVKSAGCFPAGSKISTLDGRRAGWFPAGSQMSTADGRRSDTGPDDAPGGLFLTSAGNAIVLDHSELSLLDCPGQATNSTIALTSHGGPIHKVTASVVPSRIMVLTGFKCNYPPPLLRTIGLSYRPLSRSCSIEPAIALPKSGPSSDSSEALPPCCFSNSDTMFACQTLIVSSC